MEELDMREQLRDVLHRFVQTVVQSQAFCVSVFDPSYNLALIILGLFGVTILPYSDQPTMYNTIPVGYGSTINGFVFKYSPTSNSIMIPVIPTGINLSSKSTLIENIDKLEEKIDAYIDNKSDSDIEQMYVYVFLAM